ncbi:hypothetical protein MJO29_001786 [Puccinia striiformis f. sp. tritici]|nr:hypothetical protein MJO29_001786 [Puccinia striiformis f. sp. tritici]
MANPTTEPIDIETSPSTNDGPWPIIASTYCQVLSDHPSATKKTRGRKPTATKQTKPAIKKPTKPVARKPCKPAARKKDITNNLLAIQSNSDVEVENNNLPAIQTNSDDEVSKVPCMTKKDDDTTVHNEVSFARGITALAKSNVTKTTLNLSMINPNKVAKKLHQAQVLAKELLHKKVAQDKAEAKEARTAKRKAANCGTNDDDDDDDDQEDDEDVVDDVKFHMREINKFNLANVLYDHDLQVCISPADKTKYATLTHVICQTWAQAIVKTGSTRRIPQKGSDLKHENLRKLKLKVLACVIASAAQWAWRIVTTNSIV